LTIVTGARHFGDDALASAGPTALKPDNEPELIVSIFLTVMSAGGVEGRRDDAIVGKALPTGRVPSRCCRDPMSHTAA
jgi:hypothetical protein